MPPRMDILLAGGTVCDGTGRPPVKADIGVSGGKIVFVGKLSARTSGVVVSAAGKVVSPGFIDIHTHSDITALANPESVGKLTQGITTEIAGNCGYSAFPVPEGGQPGTLDKAERYGIEVDWTDARSYFARLAKAGTAVNRGFLVGHGAVREFVTGRDDVRPTPEQLEKMCEEVKRAVEVGAFGLSSGLIYPPGCYSDTDELVAMAKASAEAGGVYASHIRGEGDSLEAAIDEALEIGHRSGARVEISHVKVAGKRNWDKIEWLLKRLKKAQSEGVNFAADRYPYVASATSLSAILPNWAHAGGVEELLQRLESNAQRKRMAADILKSHPEKEYWTLVRVATANNASLKQWEGLTLGEAAERMHLEPVEALFQLLRRDHCDTTGVFFSMRESNLERILSLPFVSVASDSDNSAFSGPTASGKPHPRTFGTFPRVLRRYVREKKVLSLEEAVRKMTLLPAQSLGIPGRGLIKKGCYADIAVFDPDKVSDRATFENPFQPAVGMEHVIVNGKFALRGGEPTAELPGKLLRRGQA